jgi:homoserine dehydrogenase
VLQQTPTLQARIKKICIKNLAKKREAPTELFTTNYNDLLEDEEINVIVELISDAKEAYTIVTTALKKKKSVVSANKKLIAEHLAELIALQRKHSVSFLYEGAVCGSIPIIRNLEEYYDNDLLQSICGIVNGSTNYILTKIREEKLDYHQALLQAQQLGFAEADPALDVEGKDAVNKLTILLAHGHGVITAPTEILHRGITQIQNADALIALEKNVQIKLIAQAKKLSDNKIAAFVLPQFVTNESQLFNVRHEFNGVVIESSFSDKQFLYGKGAGRFPTASAVLSDISALRYGYSYEYRKLGNSINNELSNDFYLKLYVSFDAWSDIDLKDFEYTEELYCQKGRQYLIGVIHYTKLKNANWLSNNDVSVIVCPDGIIENIDTHKLKKKSLQLAGVEALDKTEEFILAKAYE